MINADVDADYPTAVVASEVTRDVRETFDQFHAAAAEADGEG